jgi:hypothetical protein
MRITELHFAGTSGVSAIARRKPDSEYIEVEIAAPHGTRKHTVQADDRDDLWSMAECLVYAFEGVRGCAGDITPYFLPLELMSDL